MSGKEVIAFDDAPSSVDEMKTITGGVDGVLVANMSEGGRTPPLTLHQLHDLGFGVVIYPTSMLRIASHAFEVFLGDLDAAGSSHRWREQMHGLSALNDVVGLPDHLAVQDRFASAEFPRSR